MVNINVIRIFCSVIERRKEKSAFWFSWFIIARYRADCTDNVFVDFFGFPETFVISRLKGDVVGIMKEIYSIGVVGMVAFCNIFVKIPKGHRF